MTARLLFDETPFLLRAVRLEEDRPVKLAHAFLTRQHPPIGALYRAKVTSLDKRLGAAFLTLGAGGDGFLRRQGKLPNVGETITVRVRREPIGGKGADVTDRVSEDEIASLDLPTSPGPIAQNTLWEVLGDHLGVPEEATAVIADGPMKAAMLKAGIPVETAQRGAIAAEIDAAEDEALQTLHGLRGGGRLTIEETEALCAIDLDLGSQGGQSVKGAGANLLAASLAELSRLLPLKAVGGQIVIDIPRGAIAAPKIVRDQVTRALKPLGRVSIPAVTPEGLVVAIAPRPVPSVRDRLTEPCGEGAFAGRRFAPDVLAARAMGIAIRALEQDRSAAFTLSVPARIVATMTDNALPALTAAFGPRVTIAPGVEEAVRVAKT